MKILGVKRATEYSPNHTENDSQIFHLTMQHLEEKGYEVDLISEEKFLTSTTTPNAIFAMARNQSTVSKLQQLEQEGITVVNSGYAIESCYRANLTQICLEKGVSYPFSKCIDTTVDFFDEVNNFPHNSFWIKRGDVHAIHKEDVVQVFSKAEGKNVLREFALRGIKTAVIQEHIHGDIIKFYAVRKSDFFHWFYLLDTNHTKFGIEQNSNTNNHTEFSEEKLRAVAEKAANALNLDIYGGDIIVKPDGSLWLIDLNDWPSFAPVREQASLAIANLIHQRIGGQRHIHLINTK